MEREEIPTEKDDPQKVIYPSMEKNQDDKEDPNIVPTQE